VEQARLDEFRRLHDEAVQVLERVSAADSREETALRVYAASAAQHLRAAIDRPGDRSGSVAPSVRAALDRATAGFAALGFRITVLAEEPLPHLDFHALTELGSAVTEALNNSVKHSGACSAVVRARRASDRVEVSVEDEGAGFAAGPARYGFGITHSICRRLAEAGGGAEVRSAPGAGTVVTMWLPMLSRTGMQTWAYPGLRPERTLTMLALASRAAYCLYSAAVVALNLAGYRRPALAVAALVVALASSAWLGARVYRARTVSAPVAVLDTAVAAAVLIMVAAAIAPSGRTGSLNWALAYAVACAFWLAFGEGRTLRAVLACALGIVYGVSVLHGAQAGTAVIITAVVNAASPPMYFGIAAAVSWVMHRTSAEVSAARELEQRQRRELAALAERGRLVREVHGSVLATLDSIAARQRPWEELRGRARAEVSALRATLSGTVGAGPADPLGLRGRLACLIRDRAGQGWRIDLVDDEIERDPPPEVIEALCAALAELTEGSPPPDGLSRVRAQSCAAAAHADVLIRVPVCGQAIAGLVGQARSRLTTVGGTAELERALPGEVRVRLRAPV
jgi:signal transduction histidine kinase